MLRYQLSGLDFHNIMQCNIEKRSHDEEIMPVSQKLALGDASFRQTSAVPLGVDPGHFVCDVNHCGRHAYVWAVSAPQDCL